MITNIPIGTKGVWSLAAPFNGMLLANVTYECIAIRKLSDILASGNDPEADYYTANSLDANRYISDLNSNVSIITLQNSSGNIVYVPSSFINNYPDIGGVPYRVLALTINLGAVPDSMDLSYLKSRLKDMVLETVGVDSPVNTVAISEMMLLTNADATLAEVARTAMIGTTVTDYSKYLAAVAERDLARTKIAELEAFIVSKKAILMP